MASGKWERSEKCPQSALVEADEPVMPDRGADPYEATVERLFALLEENQVAIATLAQAWRHKSRALELAQAELAHTQEALAAERRLYRKTAS